jgi:hypothetical protein
MNPLLYQAREQQSRDKTVQIFHEIVKGKNPVYVCGVGYNCVCGCGTIDATNFDSWLQQKLGKDDSTKSSKSSEDSKSPESTKTTTASEPSVLSQAPIPAPIPVLMETKLDDNLMKDETRAERQSRRRDHRLQRRAERVSQRLRGKRSRKGKRSQRSQRTSENPKEVEIDPKVVPKVDLPQQQQPQKAPEVAKEKLCFIPVEKQAAFQIVTGENQTSSPTAADPTIAVSAIKNFQAFFQALVR